LSRPSRGRGALPSVRWCPAFYARRVPRSIRMIVLAEAAVLLYGGVVHVVQLAAGDRYGWAPTWLAIYFMALTVVDPLAAVLLLLRRRAGLYFGVAVLVTDAAANGYAVYGLSYGPAVAAVGQAIISVLALAMLVTAPMVRPWLR
jgi:hypothetical protein